MVDSVLNIRSELQKPDKQPARGIESGIGRGVEPPVGDETTHEPGALPERSPLT